MKLAREIPAVAECFRFGTLSVTSLIRLSWTSDVGLLYLIALRCLRLGTSASSELKVVQKPLYPVALLELLWSAVKAEV